MAESTISTLKEAIEAYRNALSSLSDEEWKNTVESMGFNPTDEDWPSWEGELGSLRDEMDFFESLDDEDSVYITLSYVDDNEMNPVTGITATDGNGNVLLDIDFIIPVDLSKPILSQLNEEAI